MHQHGLLRLKKQEKLFQERSMAASVRSVMILRSITILTTLAVLVKPERYVEHFALLIDVLLALLAIILFPCQLAHKKSLSLKYVIS